MTDRHWAGGGNIYVESRILEAYLKIVNKPHLDKTRYEIIKIEHTNTQSQFTEMENQVIEKSCFH